MNRRDIAKAVVVPLFGLGALPVVVAAAEHADTDQPRLPRPESDDETFYAVVMFDRGRNDFIVRGVYTLKSDADAHTERLTAAGHKPVANIVANRSWLQEHFIGERIGALKDVLERLEARLMIDAHG
jgi:hypothetical protein